MGKRGLVYLALITMFAGSGYAREVSTQQRPVPAWFMNLRIGTPLQDFVQMRPKAERTGLHIFDDEPPPPIDINDADQDLQEILEIPKYPETPETRVYSQARYVFRGGRLRGATLGIMRHTSKFPATQASVLTQCVERWGPGFERKATRVEARQPFLAPMLVWREGGVRVYLFCTPPLENVTVDDGMVILTMFDEDYASLFEPGAPQADVDEETLSELFSSIGF